MGGVNEWPPSWIISGQSDRFGKLGPTPKEHSIICNTIYILSKGIRICMFATRVITLLVRNDTNIRMGACIIQEMCLLLLFVSDPTDAMCYAISITIVHPSFLG